MQHSLPTSSEAGVRPAPAPAVTADTVADTNTSTFKDEIVMVKDFSCDRVLTKEEKKLKAIEDKFVYFDDIEDEECPTLVEDRGHRSISELGTIVDIFDAKYLADTKNGRPMPGVPVLDFKTDRPLVDMLTKCAKLAIDDYNLKMKTNYRFVDFEMAVWQLVNGVFYHITFRARNAEKECQTFQATLFANRLMREVVEFRMKGSNTWYDGTLSELID